MYLFGKESETLIFVSVLVLKRLDKTPLSYRSLIGIADAEAAMILRVGCMQTIESFLNEHDSFIFKVIYWNT